ncbi:MAG: putative nucleotidyltransferase with HDIG domain [Oleispira sp.]|jgi:putative nucleotidyltransferase with HDIG domain
MIKRISIDKLRPEMYVSDLNCDWIPHHTLQKEGRIPNDAIIAQIKRRGIKEVYIDTDRGLDEEEAITQQEVDQQIQAKLDKAGAQNMANAGSVTVEEELFKATKLQSQAKSIMTGVLNNVKMGKPLETETFDDLADGMIDSVMRNHNALACLGRIRAKDNYLMEHSINLAVLMGIFAKSIKIDRETMHQAMVGALLHDIGKIMVPDSILRKPGKLDDNEFARMKQHVVFSRDLLQKTPGIHPLTVDVAAQHHERIDGSGYPEGLMGCDICREGKMVAITDVYDAITSDRCYHKGLPPTVALKKLLEWSGTHLEEKLVHTFIRSMGIYPVGSLVMMESGRLAVVIEASEKYQTRPVVKVIYHSRLKQYIPVEIIDLSKPASQDNIKCSVDADKWRIKTSDFLA